LENEISLKKEQIHRFEEQYQSAREENIQQKSDLNRAKDKVDMLTNQICTNELTVQELRKDKSQQEDKISKDEEQISALQERLEVNAKEKSYCFFF
jgi:predicted  nucleic acid-binding Zn-ribbon protein